MRTPDTDHIPMRRRKWIWYARKQVDGKRIEICLGTRDEALARTRAHAAFANKWGKLFGETWSTKVEEAVKPTTGWLWLLWNRNLRRKPHVTLDLFQLRELALRSGGRCAVSGIKFVTGSKLHPYQPSLDRIDNSRGYVTGNVRFVCLVVNYLMNRWGEQVFHRLAVSMARQHLETLERDLDGASVEQVVSNRSQETVTT